MYPSTLTMLEQQPIRTAPHGSITMSAHAPTATPPASVAFCICTYVNMQTTQQQRQWVDKFLIHMLLGNKATENIFVYSNKTINYSIEVVILIYRPVTHYNKPSFQENNFENNAIT